MANTAIANDDGNCLPTHHEGSSRNGGFQRVGQNSYEENDDSDDELDNNSEEALSLNELMYSAHSFHVMVIHHYDSSCSSSDIYQYAADSSGGGAGNE